MLTAELKVNIISFNKQLLYAVGNVRIPSIFSYVSFPLNKNILDSVWQSYLINNFMNVDPIHNIHTLALSAIFITI